MENEITVNYDTVREIHLFYFIVKKADLAVHILFILQRRITVLKHPRFNSAEHIS